MERRRIDSPKNPLLKETARLRERRERERNGRFLIEGTREVERAASAGVLLERVFVAPELARPEGRSLASRLERGRAEVIELTAIAFSKLSMRQNPDGLLAVARTWLPTVDQLELPADPLLLIVDGLEKPGNLGALIRTADAAAASAVLSSGSGTDPFNPNVIRASMGSIFSTPFAVAEASTLLAFLAKRRVRIVATSPDAPVSYWDADLRGPLALVVGTEHHGLGPDWLTAADERVKIPMAAGLADSLNVATAGALVLYEALRQRTAGHQGDLAPLSCD